MAAGSNYSESPWHRFQEPAAVQWFGSLQSSGVSLDKDPSSKPLVLPQHGTVVGPYSHASSRAFSILLIVGSGTCASNAAVTVDVEEVRSGAETDRASMVCFLTLPTSAAAPASFAGGRPEKSQANTHPPMCVRCRRPLVALLRE